MKPKGLRRPRRAPEVSTGAESRAVNNWKTAFLRGGYTDIPSFTSLSRRPFFDSLCVFFFLSYATRPFLVLAREMSQSLIATSLDSMRGKMVTTHIVPYLRNTRMRKGKLLLWYVRCEFSLALTLWRRKGFTPHKLWIIHSYFLFKVYVITTVVAVLG